MRSSNSGSALLPEAAYSGLQAVVQISQGTPLSVFGNVAQIAIDIWDKSKAVRQNKVEFKKLASKAGMIITAVWGAISASGANIPAGFMQNATELTSVLMSIQRLVLECAGRGIVRRWFSTNNDLGCIEGFHRELDDAKDKFGIEALVDIRATVGRIENKQTEGFSTQKSTPGRSVVNNADKVDNRKGITADSVSNSGSIRLGDGRDTFHGNVYNESNSNHGNGMFNNVRGNQTFSGEPNVFNSNATPWSPGH